MHNLALCAIPNEFWVSVAWLSCGANCCVSTALVNLRNGLFRLSRTWPGLSSADGSLRFLQIGCRLDCQIFANRLSVGLSNRIRLAKYLQFHC